MQKWLTKAPPLGPCVDGTFLPDHPAALMKNGLYNKVDLMSGATKDEGNLFTIGTVVWVTEDLKSFLTMTEHTSKLREYVRADHLAT